MAGGTSRSGVAVSEAVCIIRNETGIPWADLEAEAKVAFGLKDSSRIKREECAMVTIPGGAVVAFRNEDAKPWSDHLALALKTFPVQEGDVQREDVLVVTVHTSGGGAA